MKWFSFKWETHDNTAGGTGRIEANTADDAKEAVREIIRDEWKGLDADKLIIEVEEVK